MRTLRLKRGCERRALAGHLWIFSNELDPPDALLLPGEDVRVEDHRGRLIGSGTFSPQSLISVRLHSRGREEPLDADLIRRRVDAAYRRRVAWLGEAGARSCRLLFAEGDRLPGVVADRFGDHLVLQLQSAAAEARAEWIMEAFEERVRPASILLRNDSPAREHEGLVREVRAGRGEPPARVRFPYGPLTLVADLAEGQKTGFFFDQRENYRLLAPFSPGARVLDAFCYSGAWGLHALAAGAARVDFLDRSQGALDLARENASLNGFLEKSAFHAADALDYLKSGERYDLVVLDPPAFVKSRRRVPEALKGYLNLNKWGLRAVEPGGVMVSASCSQHVRPEVFVEMLALAAREAGREVRVLALLGQPPDHPWVPAMPETAYLKAALLAVD